MTCQLKQLREALQEYMYQKPNDSPETEVENKFQYVEKTNMKQTKEQTDRNPKTKRLDCIRCGTPTWSEQYDCHARDKKCTKRGKPGHYAKCCRSTQKTNHLAEEEK